MSLSINAQTDLYDDSLQSFRNRYINTHEVVTGEDRKLLQFFPVDRKYAVPAQFERIVDAPWFNMPTSGSISKVFRIYGILNFTLQDKSFRLHVYQSKNLMSDPQYANYLFIPFTDQTNGEITYEAGRYIDLSTDDLLADDFILDFNKAYNPYCAYISNKYNCPVPPKENELLVEIKAGEKKWNGGH
ncbi:MAG: DUF1684 domain-containing protein [Chitinophagaceae bacterium]|nr:DUF1684 domain-containing protein [Chitinophagaceae bacterium]